MKVTSKLLAFVAVMGSVGNLLGLYAIKLPISAPGVSVDFHLSQLPVLLVAVTLGPVWGALTGFLSLISVTALYIKNPFVPLGNAILGYIAGVVANRRFSPIISGVMGEVAETPFIWFSILFWAGIVGGVPFPALIPITIAINTKAFIEVIISATIVEFLLIRKEIRSMISAIKG